MFGAVGRRTPVPVRFSTVGGEQGSGRRRACRVKYRFETEIGNADPIAEEATTVPRAIPITHRANTSRTSANGRIAAWKAYVRRR